jgi:type III secretory pathway component EscU
MVLQKMLLLAVFGAGLLLAYSSYQFWNKKINPRQSFKHFIIYMAVNLVSVFVIVFLFSFVIIYFKEFFFKK